MSLKYEPASEPLHISVKWKITAHSSRTSRSSCVVFPCSPRKSREGGRLKAKVQPLLTLGNSRISFRFSAKKNFFPDGKKIDGQCDLTWLCGVCRCESIDHPQSSDRCESLDEPKSGASLLTNRSRAKKEQISQSGPDFGPGVGHFQVKGV